MKPIPMTREILAAIGKCCGLGCSQCPYIPRNSKGSTKLDKEEANDKTMNKQKKGEPAQTH